MSEFVNSLKADLLDRRLLPLFGFLCLCLIGAVAYAFLGNSSSGSGTTPPPSGSVVHAASGVAVSPSTPETAVAETTDGVHEQHGGKARNPFSPLPGAGTSNSGSAANSSSTKTTSSSSSSNSSSGSGSGTSGSTGGSSGSGSGGGSKKSSKPKQQYAVTIKLGVVPAGVNPEQAQLTEYANLALNAPLPDAKQALLVFRGVTAKGKTATFSVVSEVILHGVGSCLPNATQCQAVDLKPGDSEQMEYIKSDGETVLYDLKVISIAPITGKASAARRKAAFSQSSQGTTLLRHEGLLVLPFLRYSSSPGVLVFPRRGAFASRAHASRRRRHS